MDDKQFDLLGDSMIEWLAGDSYELAPLDNWWNFLDGFMMGLKFKPIVPFLTSANIQWSLQDIIYQHGLGG